MLAPAAMGPIASEHAYKDDGETIAVRMKVLQRAGKLGALMLVVLLGKGWTMLIACDPTAEPRKVEEVARRHKGQTTT